MQRRQQRQITMIQRRYSICTAPILWHAIHTCFAKSLLQAALFNAYRVNHFNIKPTNWTRLLNIGRICLQLNACGLQSAPLESPSSSMSSWRTPSTSVSSLIWIPATYIARRSRCRPVRPTTPGPLRPTAAGPTQAAAAAAEALTAAAASVGIASKAIDQLAEQKLIWWRRAVSLARQTGIADCTDGGRRRRGAPLATAVRPCACPGPASGDARPVPCRRQTTFSMNTRQERSEQRQPIDAMHPPTDNSGCTSRIHTLRHFGSTENVATELSVEQN